MKTLEIRAELSGIINKIHCEPGVSLAAGDLIATLEAMKLEVPIEAPAHGTLLSLHIAPGEMVEEDQLLATLTL